jgi:hypothetical protein
LLTAAQPLRFALLLCRFAALPLCYGFAFDFAFQKLMVLIYYSTNIFSYSRRVVVVLFHGRRWGKKARGLAELSAHPRRDGRAPADGYFCDEVSKSCKIHLVFCSV